MSDKILTRKEKIKSIIGFVNEIEKYESLGMASDDMIDYIYDALQSASYEFCISLFMNFFSMSREDAMIGIKDAAENINQ
ncbi:MAG: hypothetical protein DWP95_10345 [Proteobacteria bacterium]|nr:MAG: hypothetical protein DWP95_10345 [Pseudomonadota bacterium]